MAHGNMIAALRKLEIRKGGEKQRHFFKNSKKLQKEAVKGAKVEKNNTNKVIFLNVYLYSTVGIPLALDMGHHTQTEGSESPRTLKKIYYDPQCTKR